MQTAARCDTFSPQQRGMGCGNKKGNEMQGVVKFIKGCLLFALLWGLFMWFCFWQKEGMETGMAILQSLYAGVIYQAMTTLIARFKARRQAKPL
ncbi:MAG: DUF6404 family protein [Pantoea sp.]|nr:MULTISPECIES: DUF6404 family protein [Pantoea]MDU5781736.1 DUF6404 family protein [Pantoea sp.]